jgi:TonB family protein
LSDPNLQRRDWMSTGLTIAVIALALVLGWMLGRVGWERAMGGRKSQANVSASQQRASQSSSPAEGEPILVEPAERSSVINRAPRQAPTQAKSATGAGSDGGLAVYEGGKLIFQQNSVAGSGRSITSSIAANSDAGLSPDNPSEAQPIVVSSQVASAHLVQRIEPIYPEEARERYIQGEVVLEAVVAKDGTVKELRLISGDSQLAAAASAAVQQWRFRPYEQRGKPADFSTRLTVNFRLH